MSLREAHASVRVIIFLAMAAFFARASVASTMEGFFCVGPDYFAYEFETGDHTPAGRPGLYVVKLGGPDGFADPVVYEFNPGSVRAMRCSQNQVQLLDDESIRTIDLDGPRTAPSACEPDHDEHVYRRPIFVGR